MASSGLIIGHSCPAGRFCCPAMDWQMTSCDQILSDDWLLYSAGCFVTSLIASRARKFSRPLFSPVTFQFEPNGQPYATTNQLLLSETAQTENNISDTLFSVSPCSVGTALNKCMLCSFLILQAWSSASPRGQWRTGENGENWLQNHLWCPNDPGR